MSLTPEQLAKIQQKESTLPDALRRDALTNYREGYFFVTINTRGYAPILSYISGRADANDGAEDKPRCVYTELGKRVNAGATSPISILMPRPLIVRLCPIISMALFI